MSLERNRFGFDGEITISCDDCGAEEHTETPVLTTAILIIKENGWRVIRGLDGWEHRCPSCWTPQGY